MNWTCPECYQAVAHNDSCRTCWHRKDMPTDRFWRGTVNSPHCYRPTNDSWHPCFPNHTACIKLSLLLTSPLARVSVWGGDDTGYEQDFGTFAEAKIMYERLSKMIVVNRDTLEFYGFYPA